MRVDVAIKSLTNNDMILIDQLELPNCNSNSPLSRNNTFVTDIHQSNNTAIHFSLISLSAQIKISNNKNDMMQQQVPKAAVLGLMVRDAMDTAQEQEERVVEILSEVMELRMQRIESRLSTLDDVEDMLETERVALELERRDLYTARCRHWFGGT